MSSDLRLSPTLSMVYDEVYDDAILEWRSLGAKSKAENILSVCAGNTFSRVLDCGAGEGSVMAHLSDAGFSQEFYAVEISKSALEQLQKKAIPALTEALKFDGYSIPYEDDFFDLVYCSHVIEHVEHPRLLLRELKRVAKKVALEVPLDYTPGADKNIAHFLSYGHINIYTPTTFRFLLRSEGMEILDECYSRTSDEVIRYNWYKNMGLEKTFFRELKLIRRKLRNMRSRWLLSEKEYQERCFSAYTCLVDPVGSIQIMGKK